MTTKKSMKSGTKKRERVAKPRPQGRRAQNKQEIRDRIVKAALSLFQMKGFDATTTKAIARKAGIAEGTVFNYFKSKDDIALYFFEQEVDRSRRGAPVLTGAFFRGCPPSLAIPAALGVRRQAQLFDDGLGFSHASTTSTPFQKAIRSLICAASGLGSG